MGAAIPAAPNFSMKGKVRIMRKLMWFTIGFGLVCAFCAYFWATSGLTLPALGFLGLFAAFLMAGKWTKKLRVPAAVCLGCALGLLWFQTYSSNYLSLATKLDGQLASVTARCTDYSYETDLGCGVEGFLYLDGKPVRTKFYLNNFVEIEPGDALRGVFEMHITTPEGDTQSAYYSGKGIFLLAYQEEDAELIKVSSTPYWAYPAIWRQNLKDLINSAFPEDTAAFASALLLGDRTGIDYETNTNFKVSGILHIIAVSGLHVTILFTLIYVLCFKRRGLVVLIGIPVMVLFAAVAGFSPSVTRAAIMMILMMLAMLFDRDYDGPTELAFACLVMLAANPLVITSVSFQLSVGSVAGIFLFREGIRGWLLDRMGSWKHRKIGKWISGSLAITLSAMTLTTPLVAYYYGTVSLIGVLTNVLALWVISFIFYGIMLVCLLAAFWPTVGAAVAWVIAWPIRYVLLVADIAASIPMAAVYTRSIYIVVWLVFCYVMLGLFLLSKRKKPKVLAYSMVLVLCLAVIASWAELWTDQCRMTVLDVGQGQCILLQADGKTYMVDCGGTYEEEAADLAAETLLSQGIGRIDGLILTHYDWDHTGGVVNLLTRIRCDALFVPDAEDEDGVAGAIAPLVDGDVISVREDISLAYSDTTISIFGPVTNDSGNDSCLAVLFRSGTCDILVTGDRSSTGEWVLTKSGNLPRLDVLVAGHHGSKHSTTEELLDATDPGIVVISVGRNSYGHPAQELLDRLEERGITVYRTDIDGNIIIRR